MSINFNLSKYSQQDDISLLRMYRNGDVDACSALIIRYLSVINNRISYYYIKGIEIDDLRQEAFIGLFNAIRSYDKTKNTSFFTYANNCISNKLKNLLAFASTNKSTVYNKSISINEIEDDIISDNSVLSPEMIFIKNEEYSTLLDLIEQNLTKLESDVLFLYLSGCDYSTVAQRLNFPQKSVDNALQRARRKLKKVLNNL